MEFKSEVDINLLQEIIRTTLNDVYQQFNFKGSHSAIQYDFNTNEIIIQSSNDANVLKMEKMLRHTVTRLGSSNKFFTSGQVAPASGGRSKLYISVRQDLTRDEAR